MSDFAEFTYNQLIERIRELEAEVARLKDELIGELYAGNLFKASAEAAEAKVARVKSLQRYDIDKDGMVYSSRYGEVVMFNEITAALQEPEHTLAYHYPEEPEQ